MDIIGHSKIIKLLDRSIEKENVAQAYIFSGPVGVGKFTMALDFSKKLLGINPSTSSGQVNPDLIIIAPEIEPARNATHSVAGGEVKGVLKKRDIKIEKIRELQHQMALSSSGGKYRVVIIDDADRLNKASQNSLLKTLEEPNDNLILILVVQDERKILPTILSRCHKIRFGTVSREELEKSLTSGARERDQLLFWSLGRPGFMLDLVNNKEELVFRNESLESLKKLFAKNLSEKFLLAEKLSKDISLAAKTLNLWMIVIREGLMGEKKLIDVSRGKALELLDNIEKSLGIIKDTNANAKLALESLFLNF